ncbi:MAG: ABC transporter ATP-binding protein [Acidimicrobiales bacterium]
MLEIENLSVDLGETTVLDSVSLHARTGGWQAIVGPNGSGKTTLLRAIAGLVNYRGAIRIWGRPWRAVDPRRAAHTVAYVPQRPVLPPAMMVTDYVLLGRTAHHRLLASDNVRDRQVVAAVLERLELGSFADRPLGQLSGGEAQRAVLARALVQEAPIILMDEPTSSLDLGHGQLVLELADTLRTEHGLTVLSALHDLTLAAQFADSVVVLSDGRIQSNGAPHEVLTPQLIEEVFGASVEVFEGRNGPVISPTRRALISSPQRVR